MTYKHIAFLLPLLATSLIGGHLGVWNAPQTSALLASQSLNGPSKGLICPIQFECGDGVSASVSITQQLGLTRITVVAGSSKDSAVVAGASANDVTLTIECDGEDVDLTIGTSASCWSEVTSCNQVGQV